MTSPPPQYSAAQPPARSDSASAQAKTAKRPATRSPSPGPRTWRRCPAACRLGAPAAAADAAAAPARLTPPPRRPPPPSWAPASGDGGTAGGGRGGRSRGSAGRGGRGSRATSRRCPRRNPVLVCFPAPRPGEWGPPRSPGRGKGVANIQKTGGKSQTTRARWKSAGSRPRRRASRTSSAPWRAGTGGSGGATRGFSRQTPPSATARAHVSSLGHLECARGWMTRTGRYTPLSFTTIKELAT